MREKSQRKGGAVAGRFDLCGDGGNKEWVHEHEWTEVKLSETQSDGMHSGWDSVQGDTE